MIPAGIMTLIHFAGFTVAILAAMKFGETEDMRWAFAVFAGICFAIV